MPMSFGKHGTAATDGEEIIVPYTFWDRVADWVFPDPKAKYEREAILQIARRIKMKNDRLEREEAERRRREKIDGNFKLIAVWDCPLVHGDTQLIAPVEISSSGKQHRTQLNRVLHRDKGRSVYTGLPVNEAFAFLQTMDVYLTIIRPWLEGKSDSWLKDKAEYRSDFKVIN